jgi:hypothetical protein
MVLVLLHVQLDSLELDQDAKDVPLHALNAQILQTSVLIAWILSFSDQTLDHANKAQLATTVKLKSLENALEFVMLVFTSTTELVFSEDAQVDSRTMDSEVASAHQLQLEDANHQHSD